MTLSMYYIIVFPTTSLMIFTCNSFHCSCCIYCVKRRPPNRIGHENLFFAITYYAWSPSDIISNSSYLLQQITVQISTTNGLELEAQNEHKMFLMDLTDLTV